MPNQEACSPEMIKQIRKQLGLTQEEMAHRLGVSFTSVNRWENEQSKPSRLARRQIEALSTETTNNSLSEV